MQISTFTAKLDEAGRPQKQTPHPARRVSFSRKGTFSPCLPLSESLLSLSDFSLTMARWTHLIRFISVEDRCIHVGQPVDTSQDIGLDIRNGVQPRAYLVNGSMFGGDVTDVVMTVSQLLSPIAKEDCNYIRCIGMNYKDHAKVKYISRLSRFDHTRVSRAHWYTGN